MFATVPVLLTYFLFHHENRLANLRSHLVTAIVGGLSAALVICAYLLIRGCFLEYVNTVLAELLYSESYAADTGVFRSNSAWKAAVLSLEILHERYYNFSTLALLLPFYAAFLYRYRLSLFFAVNFVGVALGAYAIALGHCFFSHYFLTGTVGLLSPAIYGLTVPGDHILVVDSPMRYVSLNRRHSFRGGLLIDEMIPF